MAETSDILTKLLERTNQDKVNWQSTSEDDLFLAVLGNSSVTIREYESFGPQYSLRILNDEGRVIEGLMSESGEGANWYGEMHELYAKARRIALGVDSQLEDLLKELQAGS